MNLTKENQSFITSWEKERTQGQLLFVGKSALTFILGMIAAHVVLNYNAVTSAGITYFLEGPRLIVYILIGFGYGFYKWRRNEKKYTTSMENATVSTTI